MRFIVISLVWNMIPALSLRSIFLNLAASLLSDSQTHIPSSSVHTIHITLICLSYSPALPRPVSERRSYTKSNMLECTPYTNLHPPVPITPHHRPHTSKHTAEPPPYHPSTPPSSQQLLTGSKNSTRLADSPSVYPHRLCASRWYKLVILEHRAAIGADVTGHARVLDHDMRWRSQGGGRLETRPSTPTNEKYQL